mmetsp:Transcript_783/g.2099  ORF Transcript_783/g.2099 Transcript_783/m.2099 type:complete len:225 (-) Transcript_783:368-1042(-)
MSAVSHAASLPSSASTSSSSATSCSSGITSASSIFATTSSSAALRAFFSAMSLSNVLPATRPISSSSSLSSSDRVAVLSPHTVSTHSSPSTPPALYFSSSPLSTGCAAKDPGMGMSKKVMGGSETMTFGRKVSSLACTVAKDTVSLPYAGACTVLPTIHLLSSLAVTTRSVVNLGSHGSSFSGSGMGAGSSPSSGSGGASTGSCSGSGSSSCPSGGGVCSSSIR